MLDLVLWMWFCCFDGLLVCYLLFGFIVVVYVVVVVVVVLCLVVFYWFGSADCFDVIFGWVFWF